MRFWENYRRYVIEQVQEERGGVATEREKEFSFAARRKKGTELSFLEELPVFDNHT